MRSLCCRYGGVVSLIPSTEVIDEVSVCCRYGGVVSLIPSTEVIDEVSVCCRYGEVVSLILPQLEHGLRRVFAAVNCCPHRVLTAEVGMNITLCRASWRPVFVWGGGLFFWGESVLGGLF